MTEQPKDGGPAFPIETTATPYAPGMSLRDWFAGQALIGATNCNPNLPGSPASEARWPDAQELADRRAAWAYLQADAMIAAREVRHDG